MPPSVGFSPPETFRFAPSLPLRFSCGLPSCSRVDEQQCGSSLPLRGVATPGHGEGEGSAGDKFRVSGTQETVEGAGANEVSGVLSEASCCRCGAPLIKKRSRPRGRLLLLCQLG